MFYWELINKFEYVTKYSGLNLPQRWIFVFMGFLAFFNAYAMRVCLSIVIVEIVEPLNETKEFVVETCPTENKTLELVADSTVMKVGTFKWSEYTQVCSI